jgi:hypothetical protein
MAAPSLIEIANIKTWNIYAHYFRNRQMYVDQGRAIVAGIRSTLQKLQVSAQAPSGILTIAVAEDEIAAAFVTFLTKDKNWMAYLGRKAHMTGPVHAVMTDTMARFIASEAYVDILR